MTAIIIIIIIIAIIAITIVFQFFPHLQVVVEQHVNFDGANVAMRIISAWPSGNFAARSCSTPIQSVVTFVDIRRYLLYICN